MIQKVNLASSCYDNLTNTTERNSDDNQQLNKIPSGNQNAGYSLYQHIYNELINTGYLMMSSILTIALNWKQ